MITVIIIGVVCLILLAYLKKEEKWDNMTKPPKCWNEHSGWRQKINKL